MKNILIVLAMIMLSCGHDYCSDNSFNEKKLTNPTTIGANTMSCKIDGQIWIANGRMGKGRYCRVWHTNKYLPKNIFYFGGDTRQQCARKNGSIKFYLNKDFYTIENGVKRYKFESAKLGKIEEQRNYAEFELLKVYYNLGPIANTLGTNPNYVENGWVDITRDDTVAKVISGRFEFVAYFESPNSDSLPPVRITDGRFDINYGVDICPDNAIVY